MEMNKYKVAVSRVLRFVPENFMWSDYDVCGLLNSMADKATPMKPTRQDRYCGRCDTNRLIKGNDNYCSVCGQRVDWGDNDE